MKVQTHVRSDCPRCHSTGSVEFGLCQVCLADTSEPEPYTTKTRIIVLAKKTLELSTSDR